METLASKIYSFSTLHATLLAGWRQAGSTIRRHLVLKTNSFHLTSVYKHNKSLSFQLHLNPPQLIVRQCGGFACLSLLQMFCLTSNFTALDFIWTEDALRNVCRQDVSFYCLSITIIVLCLWDIAGLSQCKVRSIFSSSWIMTAWQVKHCLMCFSKGTKTKPEPLTYRWMLFFFQCIFPADLSLSFCLFFFPFPRWCCSCVKSKEAEDLSPFPFNDSTGSLCSQPQLNSFHGLHFVFSWFSLLLSRNQSNH